MSLIAFPFLQVRQTSADYLPLSTLASSISILVLTFALMYVCLAYSSKEQTYRQIDSRGEDVSSGTNRSSRKAGFEATTSHSLDGSGMTQEMHVYSEKRNSISPQYDPAKDKIEGYCVNCRKDRKIEHLAYIKYPNEISAVSGECTVCASKVFRILVPQPDRSRE